MIELRGNMFEPKTYIRVIGDMNIKYAFVPKPDAICITTNGFVRSDGRAVMGRGCALEAKKLFPDIDKKLGEILKTKGNVPAILSTVGGTDIVAFPVKPRGIKVSDDKSNLVEHMKENFAAGDIAPGWAARASLDLIKESAVGLVMLAEKNKWKIVVIPRPGCGAGQLKWEDVRPVLDKILDDRFYLITS